MESLIYRTNTATFEQVYEHLTACDEQFVPPLSQRLQISSYAEKLVSLSNTFEVWDGQQLVGLVAVYMNDADLKSSFITNVSVLRGYEGKGIASKLLSESIEQSKQNGFSQIVLEVDAENHPARSLYIKKGFITVSNEKGIEKMSIQIH